jgi:hypothetical protein
MRARAVLVSLSVLLGLAITSATASAASPVPGSWTINAGNVTETETNSSGQTIKAFYLKLPAGVIVTSGGSVSGATATCQQGQPDSVPNEVECFFAPPSYWQTGTSITFTFPVNDPQGKLASSPPPTFQKVVSYDGTTYTGGGPFELPPKAQQPPPQQPPGPCKCVKLTAYLNHFHIFGGSTGIEFDINWELTCSPGAGNCTGRIKALAPRGAYFIEQGGKLFPPPQPKIVTVNCSGPCNQKTKGKETVRYLALQHVKDKKGKTHTVANPRFTPKGRANKSFEIRLSILCTNPLGDIIKLRVTFDKHGQVDYKKSFLTGPG